MSYPLPDRGPHKTVLDNGLTLLTEVIPDRRSISVGAWHRYGARDEPQHLMGVSHFLEHMLFKGTTRRSAFEIAHSLESRGGQLDAFTSREYVCFYARCLDEHTDLAIDVLADVVGHSLLADDEIEREKSVVREEIQSYEDNPEEKVLDVFAQVLWGNDSLGWPILGTMESLDGITGGSLRGFYRDRYRANSMIVSIAGGFDPGRVVDQVATAFDLPRGETPSLSSEPHVEPRTVYYVPRDVAQVNLVLGRMGIPETDRRHYALSVLNSILGGGMSSRLFQTVRESAGLAYSVYSGVDYYRDTGVFTISLGVRPERASEALELVASELTKFVQRGPTAEEMEAGRSQIKGSLILSQESVSSQMTHLAMDEIYYGKFISIDEHLRRVESVTRDHVMELAREFLDPASFSLVALGPEGAEEEVRRAWPPSVSVPEI